MNDLPQLLLSEISDTNSHSFLLFHCFDPFVAFCEFQICVKWMKYLRINRKPCFRKDCYLFGKVWQLISYLLQFYYSLMSRNICLNFHLLIQNFIYIQLFVIVILKHNNNSEFILNLICEFNLVSMKWLINGEYWVNSRMNQYKTETE